MTEGIIKQYELTRARDVILDVISANISDPLTGQQARTATTDWIFDGFPNPAKIGSFWKFPIIVFDFPEIETENKVVNGSKQMITHTFSIECHGRERLEVNQLAEEVKHILETTGQSQLKTGSIHGPDIVGTTNDTDFIGGNKYYTKTTEYEFMRFD